MNKLIRRIATISASVVLVGGSLLAAEGSASAVAFAPSGHHGATAAVGTVDARFSPWIADQLALFEQVNGADSGGQHHGHDRGATAAVGTVDARFSPWIADQLALFEHVIGGDSGGQHHYEHPGHDHSERLEP